tara:strand:- start:27515 stop:29743 length:2229 start_codon:yes stop_codon:yes gene_type:complete
MSDDEPTNYKNVEKTPQEQYKYWGEELQTSIKARKPWWKRADKIVARYLGKSEASKEEMTNGFDLNLFHSNTKTLNDMLYGNLPQIDVARRYAQADDDIGRVASEMMERLLNLDVTNNGTDIDAVFRATLQDRLLGGLGCAKVRYTFESEDAPVMDEMTGVPMADPETGEPMMETKVLSEDAPIDYYFWGDITWGWCRNWAGMPWVAFRSYKTRDEVEERWSKEAADGMSFKKQTAKVGDEGVEDEESDSGTQKAEIWEIWCKETRSVHWISLGYDQQLEEKEDILGLSGFWPIPPFFMANPTTSLYTPTPDFVLAQDLYNEIDTLQTRIGVLTTAVRLVGVYNSSADNIKQMMSGTTDNQLIPVENWALFGENGGIAGQIEWMPIEAVVNAIQTLSGIRDSTISLLQQITGMTDVMRGALDNQYEGVGQTDQKAKFASVRIQALQEQFASFASNLMQIKAEVIALHFNPETIYERANMEFSKDQELIQPAIELIKNTTKANLRIQIRPESVAMVDHQALKNERSEFLNAVGSYMQSASVLMAEDPAAKPFVLQLLQWGLAGYKGSSEIEGVIDKAIEASQAQQDEDEKPDPEMQKMQMEMQKEQFKAKSDMDKIQAKGQADMAMRQADMQADIATMQEAHVRKMAEVQAGMQAKIAELQAALQADLLMEQAQAESNIRQTQATASGEMQKDLFEHELSIDNQTRKTEAELAKIITSANASIEQEMVKAELAPEPKEPKGDK